MSLLEPPQDVLAILRNCDGVSEEEMGPEVLGYVAFLAAGMADRFQFDAQVWEEALAPYLKEVIADTTDIVESMRAATQAAFIEEDDAESYGDEDDGAEELTNIRFNLAYGGKILLHQTKLKLKRGHRYGLIGQNGAGKTTLMTAICNGKLDGWPHHLITAYVDSGSNVDPVHEAQPILKYLMETTKRDQADCVAMLNTLKFTREMQEGTIGALSGGWQMKLRLIGAVLLQADILLLDEPTNHLDKGTVQWLTDYLCALTTTTVITVSHDVPFMENICTDIIHYEQRDVWGPHRKLVNYKGKMSAFVEKQPQAKHYFQLATTDLKFKFPEPGRLEGVKTNQLNSVNLKMSLSSRVAVLGANGAGKTTLVKMIVGETQPSNLGPASKFYIHPNLRIAYVAQHAFHHVEQHINDAPASYIQWRFKDGFDREKMESEAYTILPEEQEKIDEFNLSGIWSRRMRGGVMEYEVHKKNTREKDNRYYSREELLAMGFEKLLKQTDEKIAAKEAGLDLRPVTTKEIQSHLDDFGLTQEFGTYGKIRGLSGGQKVKLVLAAAMWNCPHLLVLDEPTNYLDRGTCLIVLVCVHSLIFDPNL
jgi:elongation factor 3